MREPIIVVLVALLGACTGPTDTSVSSDPSVERTPKPSPVVLPAEALPVPAPSPWAITPEDRRDRPGSSDIAIGQQRPFQLYTHCGVDFRVDFDGTFWESYAGKTRSLGNPVQRGVMTLLSDEVSVFRFESQGHQATSIYFVRNDSPKAEGVCF